MKKMLTSLLVGLVLLTGCSQPQEEENTFTVGMECNYAPFNWTSLTASDSAVQLADGSYCDGYDVEMAQYIANELDATLVIKPIEWNGLEPALSNGEIDAIIAGMTANEERRQNADFTTPYYESDMVMIVTKDSEYVNATSIQDFSGAAVRGQTGTTYDEIIDQIDGVNHVDPLPSYPYMVVSLQSGEVDGLTAELPVAIGVVSANDDLTYVEFAQGEGFDVDTSVSIAVKKGNTELLNSIQTALDTVDSETRLEWMLSATERQPASE